MTRNVILLLGAVASICLLVAAVYIYVRLEPTLTQLQNAEANPAGALGQLLGLAPKA